MSDQTPDTRGIEALLVESMLSMISSEVLLKHLGSVYVDAMEEVHGGIELLSQRELTETEAYAVDMFSNLENHIIQQLEGVAKRFINEKEETDGEDQPSQKQDQEVVHGE